MTARTSTESPAPAAPAAEAQSADTLVQKLARWWQSVRLTRDHYALLMPLITVVVFMVAIAVAFWYLRAEEIQRAQEAVRRDVEYTQQRLRLRFLERQEQVMRLARDLGQDHLTTPDFQARAEMLLGQFPELQSLTWVDQRRQVRASQAAPLVPSNRLYLTKELLPPGPTADGYFVARDQRQPVYAIADAEQTGPALIQLQAPFSDAQGQFAGVLLAETSLDGVLRYGTPTEILARYFITLRGPDQRLLAGTPLPDRSHASDGFGGLLQRNSRALDTSVAIDPLGDKLLLRAQGYRTAMGVIGSAMFWLVALLSALTVWMLFANWLHTRRRLQAQNALQAEIQFRRAMENSLRTGMRALDLQGRITYVNSAFSQMTGWQVDELVGQVPPYPFWPDRDYSYLHARLRDDLAGKSPPAGSQMRIKRKNGTLFDARVVVSPLIDARGRQTGWMTTITDITEPNRIRAQLAASHERFTVVLEALDASVSVAPLGSEELLFANKLYRQWFGSLTQGHLRLVAQAGTLDDNASTSVELDDVDDLVGLPSDSLTSAQAGNAEIFVSELGRWLEVRSRYVNWVDGRLAQLVIATDITARRQAQDLAALQAERAQAASHLVTMGEMASSVAHELNQPLSAISNYCAGMLSRLRSGSIDPAVLETALTKTAHQAQRAGQIIQRIRSFVRRSELKRTLTEVGLMVNEAVELADIELRRRNVRLTQYVAARLPKLMVDPILIEQVLVNLLKNAAESIDCANRAPQQRQIELRVVPKANDGVSGVEFAVVDSGPGLAPEIEARVFEAFFSTKADGMGIGLKLCRSIVESHQGRLQADNIYNAGEITGCRFWFWIPVQKSTAIAVIPSDSATVKQGEGS